jgi:hypothetical protein
MMLGGSMIEGGIITLDLNGVPEGTFEKQGSLRSFADLKNDPVMPRLSMQIFYI